MSKDAKVSEEVQVKPTLEDLNYFWAADGLPIFYADRHNIEDIIEDLGFSIYYMICNVAEEKEVKSTTYTAPVHNYTYNQSNYNTPSTPTTTTTVVIEKSTSIVRVVNNIIGRSVSPISGDIADLASVKETAEYNLPGIPLEIVNRLDDFFRLVDAQHGTESIVMLTFDPSKDDSSGWGVLVPEQTNTSVHCNYNPDSIVQEKPDHVLIVGSVHSHPGMAAYASGTDHADQADFDGLHITYGWQKTVQGGATQYYIEMQMAGNSWTLKPEDVFEGFVVNRQPDPEVVEWSTKVKKVLPPQGGLGFQAQQTSVKNTKQNQSITLTKASTAVGTAEAKADIDRRASTYLPEVNDSSPYVLLAEMDPNARELVCPSCDYSLSDYDLISGACPVCDLGLVSMTDAFSDVWIKAGKYMQLRAIKGDRYIYMWVISDANINEVIKLSEQTICASPVLIEVEEVDPFSVDDDDDEIGGDGFDVDLTICCFRQISDCSCAKMVLYDDITDFELAHREGDIYNNDDNCFKCTYQYTSQCALYYRAIMDHAMFGQKLVEPIGQCIDFQELILTNSVYGYSQVDYQDYE